VKRPLTLLLITFALLIIAVCVYLPPFSRYRELKQEEEQMKQQLAELERKILALEEERDLLKNDLYYIEGVIRKELKLVKPGEVIYKFVSEKAKAPKESLADDLDKITPPFKVKSAIDD
jgi:cell division protein FtsB